MKKICSLIGTAIYYVLATAVRIPVAVFLFIYAGLACVTYDKIAEFRWIENLYNWYRDI